MLTKSTIISAGNEQPPRSIARSSAIVLAVGTGFLGMAIGILATFVILTGRSASPAASASSSAQPAEPALLPPGALPQSPTNEKSVQNTPMPAAVGDVALPDTKVDPSAFLAQAKRRAPDGSAFSSLRVHFVGASGIVDLGATSYKATVQYRFSQASIPAVQKSGAPPGVMTKPVYFPDTTVMLEGAMMSVRSDSLGVSGVNPAAKAEPHCTIKEVWRAAIAAGAPADAVADISFPVSSGAAAWSFRIDGKNFDVRVDDATCTITKNRGVLDIDVLY